MGPNSNVVKVIQFSSFFHVKENIWKFPWMQKNSCVLDVFLEKSFYWKYHKNAQFWFIMYTFQYISNLPLLSMEKYQAQTSRVVTFGVFDYYPLHKYDKDYDKVDNEQVLTECSLKYWGGGPKLAFYISL